MAVKKATKRAAKKQPAKKVPSKAKKPVAKARGAAGKSASRRGAAGRKPSASAVKARPAAKAPKLKKAAKKPARAATASKALPARKAKAPAAAKKRAAPAAKRVPAPAAAKSHAAPAAAKVRPARVAGPHQSAQEQALENAETDAEAAESGSVEHAAREPRARANGGRLPRELRHEAEIDEPRERAGSPERALIDPAHPDDLAEELGEEYVKGVTSGESSMAETLDEVLPEESGGPFIETSPNTEFAGGTDESNPIDAEQEPFPTANMTTRR